MGQEKELKLKEIINQYNNSVIQSEAEVRSKLLVPIIDLLGYPSEYRSEEFPVYGWEGRKAIPAKPADYVLFNDLDFANHRDRKKDSIEWVQNHSLLVVEAKKPGEMPTIDGQSMYYVQWTKALSYIVCDGMSIRGYFKQEYKSDLEVFNCQVDELDYYKHLDFMSFERMTRLKDAICSENDSSLISVKNIDTVPEDNIISVNPDTLDYMAQCLSLDKNSMSARELIRRFLVTTDNILDCELRYNIPSYIFRFPRGEFSARVYIDNQIAPLFIGGITQYYWNEFERFYFANDFIEIEAIFNDEKVDSLSIGYSVLDYQVLERLRKLDLVEKCYKAKIITLEIKDLGVKNICLKDLSIACRKELSNQKTMIKFWMDEMQKMLMIQKSFEIEFRLEPLYGEQISELYEAVDNVYDSLVGNENCTFHFPAEMIKDFPSKCTEPFFFENKELPLPKQKIHNITFKTCASVILPYKLRKCEKRDGLVYLPCCCLYEIDNNNNDVSKAPI